MRGDRAFSVGIALFCALSLLPRRPLAVEYNFAGSVSLNYKTLVNELGNPGAERALLLSGFNLNASIKAVVDVTRYLSASVKVCYGCHGLEVLNFTTELTPHPAFNVRAGRFIPAFGDFYLRHDPTAHKTPDNPLPYDMGHMVHSREWNMGVLPVPYVDTGAEVYGTVRPTQSLSLAYAVHVVNGLKAPAGTSPTGDPAHDFDYRRSRFVTSPDYLVDNNRFPSVGGRLAITFSPSASMSAALPDITVGGSALYGTWDDLDQLTYLIYGFDFYMHVWRINLRCEVLRRQQQVDARLLDYPDQPTTGRAASLSTPAQVKKDGFYVEADFPVGAYLEGVLRFDGLRRDGPREARRNPDLPPEQPYTAAPSSALDFTDWILRYTVGVNIIPLTGAKIKLSYEYWTFKDLPGDVYRNKHGAPFQDEHMIHVAVVSSF